MQFASDVRLVYAVAIDGPPGIAVRSVADRLLRDKQTRLFLRHGFYLYARIVRRLVRDNRHSPRHLLRMLFSARTHLASGWLDLAEERLCLDPLNRNAGGVDFLPLG